ncbi:MAG: SET domain-containing protein [Candidatus Levybacteria bacterium]|nr:SET domain-containing protein [Candidatus Levybacteria bacterium]
MFLITDDYWEVRDTKEKGKGVFAQKNINSGVVIGDYIGMVVKTAEENICEDTGLYLMYYHNLASIYPDLNQNGIHLLNHSCTPNCWMYTYKGHTLFFTLRKIFTGEELTISYLLSPKDKYCQPCMHICKCGSAVCPGTMHLSETRYKKWAVFHNREEKETKKARIRYGKTLPKLTSYPKNILDNPIYSLFGSSQESPKILKNHFIPSVSEIRKLIKETGRIIYLPQLKLKITGVVEDEIVLESMLIE